MGTIKAHAKINLGLVILGKRPDGYHEINTMFHEIDLHDVITITRGGNKLTLRCSDPFLPTGQGNLVYQAATLILNHAGIHEPVQISIEKKIPVGSGLGGGSSDAAATLNELNNMFHLGLNEQELRELAVQIGADVPFFITGGAAFASGKGEILEYLPEKLDFFIVLIFPEFSISTSWVYKNYVIPLTKTKNSVISLKSALSGSKTGSWIGVVSTLTNDLETVTLQKYPELQDMKKLLLDQGASVALMSGSGSSVFGIFTSEKSCKEAQIQIQEKGYSTLFARTKW